MASTPLTEDGRAYRDLQPLERARLAQKSPEVYRRQRAAWLAAGSPARQPRAAATVPADLRWHDQTYRELPPTMRARLSRANPDLYQRMRAHWQGSGSPLPPRSNGPEVA